MSKAVSSHTGIRRAEGTVSVDTGHGAAEPEPVPDEPQRPGRKWKLALAGLIAVYVVLAGYVLIANSSAITGSTTASAVKSVPKSKSVPTTGPPAPVRASTGSPASVKPSGPVSKAAPTPTAHPLGVTSIVAFGPEGTSDGDNPGIAYRILDVSSDQPWYSQWYATPGFGNLKAGTGLLLDMGKPVTVSSVQLVLGSWSGAAVQVRVGNAASLADLSTVAAATDAGSTVRLPATGASGRYVLIWFTALPPNGQGEYQVSVYHVAVDGTARA